MTPDEHQLVALVLGMIDVTLVGILGYGWRNKNRAQSARRSSCGTAAPGYVRLEGEALPFGEVLTAGSGARAVWFTSSWTHPGKGRGGERDGVRWETSKAPFFLSDATGRVLVDPAALEVITPDTVGPTLTIAPQLHTEPRLTGERLIAPGEQLVVVGELHVEAASVEKKVAELLREWKADPESLRQRFDANNDGKVDPAEWEAARAAARSAAEASLKGQTALRVLSKPRDGKPFLAAPVFHGGLESATNQVFLKAATAIFFLATVWQAWLARH